jgi:monofunctional biosynthetic peptidoglycan transglycosylase
VRAAEDSIMPRGKPKAGKPKTARQRPARSLRRLPRRFAAGVLRWLGWALAVVVLWVGAYAVIDPPGGYYLAREWVRLGTVQHSWRDLEDISPDLARAVIAAEDAHFCDHWGFDVAAIEKALTAGAEGKRLRGASTISQQVAKNVFLWHGRSWLRKGLEAGFTVLIEAIWTKRRILEVYLNTAEFDEGVFGAEAAAEHYFGRPAAKLTLGQAARLAAVLPNPKGRSPNRATAFLTRRAAAIADGARTLEAEDRARCIE